VIERRQRNDLQVQPHLTVILSREPDVGRRGSQQLTAPLREQAMHRRDGREGRKRWSELACADPLCRLGDETVELLEPRCELHSARVGH
jgi:hypothetical protein